MKQKNSRTKRGISMLLVIVMLLSFVSVTAFAAEGTPDEIIAHIMLMPDGKHVRFEVADLLDSLDGDGTLYDLYDSGTLVGYVFAEKDVADSETYVSKTAVDTVIQNAIAAAAGAGETPDFTAITEAVYQETESPFTEETPIFKPETSEEGGIVIPEEPVVEVGEGGKETPVVVEPGDNTALLSAIEDAQTLSDSVIEGESDETVPEGQKWASKAAIDAYAAAISVAEAVAENEEATQKAIDAALAALNTATTAFQGAISEGTAAWSVDDYIDSITAQISNTNTLLGTITESTDGKDVDADKNWATKEAIETLQTAITTAQAYIDGEDYDLAEIAEVLDTLNTAVGAFVYAKGSKPVETVGALFEAAETAVDALEAYTESDLEDWDDDYRDEAYDALTAAQTAVAALTAHKDYDAETHALENEALIGTLEDMIAEYDEKEPDPAEAAKAALAVLAEIAEYEELDDETYDTAKTAIKNAEEAIGNLLSEDPDFDLDELEGYENYEANKAEIAILIAAYEANNPYKVAIKNAQEVLREYEEMDIENAELEDVTEMKDKLTAAIEGIDDEGGALEDDEELYQDLETAKGVITELEAVLSYKEVEITAEFEDAETLIVTFDREVENAPEITDFTVKAGATTFVVTDDKDSVQNTEKKKHVEILVDEDDETIYVLTFLDSIENNVKVDVEVTITEELGGKYTVTADATYYDNAQGYINTIAESIPGELFILGFASMNADEKEVAVIAKVNETIDAAAEDDTELASALAGVGTYGAASGYGYTAELNGDVWDVKVVTLDDETEIEYSTDPVSVTVTSPEGLADLTGTYTLVDSDAVMVNNQAKFADSTLVVYGVEDPYVLTENDALVNELLTNLGIGNVFTVASGTVTGITINKSTDLSMVDLDKLGLDDFADIVINGGELNNGMTVSLPEKTLKFKLAFATGSGANLGAGNTAGVTAASVDTYNRNITLDNVNTTGTSRVGIDLAQVYKITRTAGAATVIGYTSTGGTLTVAAFIGTQEYDSLKEAAAAAKSGDVIKFYDQYTIQGSADRPTLPVGVTIELMGDAYIEETTNGRIMQGSAIADVESVVANLSAEKVGDYARFWYNDFDDLKTNTLADAGGYTITVNRNMTIAGTTNTDKFKVATAGFAVADGVTLTVGGASEDDGKSLWIDTTLTLGDNAGIVIGAAGGLAIPTLTPGEETFVTGEGSFISMVKGSVFAIGDTPSSPDTKFTADGDNTGVITFEDIKFFSNGEITISSTRATSGYDKLTVVGEYAIGGHEVEETVTIASNVEVEIPKNTDLYIAGTLNVEGALSICCEKSITYANPADTLGTPAINFTGEKAMLKINKTAYAGYLPADKAVIGGTNGIQLASDGTITLTNSEESPGNLESTSIVLSGNSTIPAGDFAFSYMLGYLGSITIEDDAVVTLNGNSVLTGELIIEEEGELVIGQTGSLLIYENDESGIKDEDETSEFVSLKNAGTITVYGTLKYADNNLPGEIDDNTGKTVFKGSYANFFIGDIHFFGSGGGTALQTSNAVITTYVTKAQDASPVYNIKLEAGEFLVSKEAGLIDGIKVTIMEGTKFTIANSAILYVAGGEFILQPGAIISGGNIALVAGAKVTADGYLASKVAEAAVPVTATGEIVVAGGKEVGSATVVIEGVYTWDHALVKYVYNTEIPDNDA